jgi:excinuclease ABC subunit B
LRSETSLIQTMGRAARNVSGKVIMYADNITDSMRRAIDETNRRRRIQLEYNEKHGITPQTIRKGIRESLVPSASSDKQEDLRLRTDDPLSLDELLEHISHLEREMKRAAKALDFERAAELRDEIASLKKLLPDVKRL